MHVSSANNLGLTLVALAISFTYSVNKIGPSTDPCGTPLVITLREDFSPLTQVYC